MAKWRFPHTCFLILAHVGKTAALTGFTGPKAVGVPSAATVDERVTGLEASDPHPIIPAQGVGHTGALVHRERAGVWTQKVKL